MTLLALLAFTRQWRTRADARRDGVAVLIVSRPAAQAVGILDRIVGVPVFRRSGD